MKEKKLWVLLLQSARVSRFSPALIGIGIATGKATEAVARQPEADGKISKLLLLGCALAEATAIYGFVIALLLLVL